MTRKLHSAPECPNNPLGDIAWWGVQKFSLTTTATDECAATTATPAYECAAAAATPADEGAAATATPADEGAAAGATTTAVPAPAYIPTPTAGEPSATAADVPTASAGVSPACAVGGGGAVAPAAGGAEGGHLLLHHGGYVVRRLNRFLYHPLDVAPDLIGVHGRAHQGIYLERNIKHITIFILSNCNLQSQDTPLVLVSTNAGMTRRNPNESENVMINS